MRVYILVVFLLVFPLLSCVENNRYSLPEGYKVWVMNSKEVYLSDKNNELLVGPSLKEIGLSKNYIVTYSGPVDAEYVGYLKTKNYSVLDLQTKILMTDLSEQDARDFLSKHGDVYPKMLSFNEYNIVDQ